MAVIADALAQRFGEARLADPGLAAEQHHLALAAARALPAVGEQRDLVLAPDQPPRRAHRRKTAVRLALAQHAPHADGRGEPLERALAQEPVFEQLAREAPRDAGDEHAAGLGQRLEAGGEIGRVADDGLLLRRAGADDLADHHQPGGDADARGQGAVADRGHCGSDREPGANRALDAVLMRLGIAEIGQHPVAHELGEEPVEAGDDAGAGILILPQQAPQILGIEPRRQLGRAGEIAEHHRHLAPLGLGRGRGRGFRRRWRRGDRRRLARRLAQLRRRRHQLAPVAERQPQLRQILIAQRGQHVEIDIVLDQRRRILAEAQSVEPGCEIAHGPRLRRRPRLRYRIPPNGLHVTLQRVCRKRFRQGSGQRRSEIADIAARPHRPFATKFSRRTMQF